jgi:four helix bundle protein
MAQSIPNFFDQLKQKMDTYVHKVYSVTKNFPREEQYGITSQFRRASLSVILNFIEGYARKRIAVKLNFWETAYGSFQESKYLIGFSYKEGLMDEEKHAELLTIADEIGAMLWRALDSLEKNK